MNELSSIIDRSVDDQFTRLAEDRELREKVADKLFQWLVNTARKKPIPNLDVKLEEWRGRIKHLSENLEIKFERDKLVVTSAGSADDTLKRLRLGSDWFDGSGDILEMIVAALFKSDSTSI